MAPFSGDIEATGAVGSQKLLELGLSPFTADCVHRRGIPLSGRLSVENGPFTLRNQENGDMPVWSAGRLLTLLPTSEDFYWSLYRAEGTGLFVLTVYANDEEKKFSAGRLIEVALPAMVLCLETNNFKSDWADVSKDKEGGLFRRGLSKGISPSIDADLGTYFDRAKLFEELYGHKPIVSDAVDAVRHRVEVEVEKAARYREYLEKTSAKVITLDKDGNVNPVDRPINIGDIVKSPEGDTLGMVFKVEPEGKISIVELK